MNKYKLSVGFEIHVELKTKSKLFCGCKNEFGALPNTLCCPICTGQAGVMPTLNSQAVRLAVRAGLALGCKINTLSVWDRKNYFYPDLPKGWQTSQNALPICESGELEYFLGQEKKSVKIARIHLEEDAGKLLHEQNETLIDYNRCGVPLIEIVTEPMIHSKEDAVAFLEELRFLLKENGISDCKMQEGSLRVDVNLSVSKDLSQLGIRTETKNLSSFKSVSVAIENEYFRQKRILSSGKKIIEQTRRLDEQTGKSFKMRNKEKEQDYRFIVEPDLMPLKISQEDIENEKNNLALSRVKRIEQYVSKYLLPFDDAKRIASEKQLCVLFDETAKIYKNYKAISNLILGEILRKSKITGSEDLQVQITPQQLKGLLELVDEKTISQSTAQGIVLSRLWGSNENAKEIALILGVVQIKDINQIRQTIEEVLLMHSDVVMQYKNGNAKVLAFLVGQCMKASNGRLNPTMVNEIINDMINKA